jgi:hypothetical protein
MVIHKLLYLAPEVDIEELIIVLALQKICHKHNYAGEFHFNRDILHEPHDSEHLVSGKSQFVLH